MKQRLYIPVVQREILVEGPLKVVVPLFICDNGMAGRNEEISPSLVWGHRFAAAK